MPTPYLNPEDLLNSQDDDAIVINHQPYIKKWRFLKGNLQTLMQAIQSKSKLTISHHYNTLLNGKNITSNSEFSPDAFTIMRPTGDIQATLILESQKLNAMVTGATKR